jgi:hypothetical protein
MPPKNKRVLPEETGDPSSQAQKRAKGRNGNCFYCFDLYTSLNLSFFCEVPESSNEGVETRRSNRTGRGNGGQNAQNKKIEALINHDKQVKKSSIPLSEKENPMAPGNAKPKRGKKGNVTISFRTLVFCDILYLGATGRFSAISSWTSSSTSATHRPCQN